jgi:hemolysin activation/secretion protein
LDDIEDLRLKITRLYVDAGYINSGAVIADPPIKESVLEVRVVEGGLTSIEITGNKWIRKSYFRQRVKRAAGTPMRVGSLQQRLQLLNVDGLISRFDAQLLPGAQPGESVLKLAVKEEFPIKAFVTYNNYQAPAIGDQRVQATVVHQNVTGFGDTLSFTYGRSTGINPLIDAYYSFPVTPYDTTLTAAYRRNNSLVVEESLQDLDITSDTDMFSISLRQPLAHRLSGEFAAGVTFDHQRNKAFLLGEPFSFSHGILDGRYKISALRLFQEWTRRSQVQVIMARSRFSIGLDAFDSTVNGGEINGGEIPDSRFLSWLGQGQFARRLRHDIQVIARGDVQLSNDPLLPLEQLPLGGRFTVRGYRENQLVRDNGVAGSLEGRLPVIRQHQTIGRVELAAFVDFGHAWNSLIPELDIDDSTKSTLVSTGLGLRWSGTRETRGVHPYAEIYWGIPLNRIPITCGSTSLQEYPKK